MTRHDPRTECLESGLAEFDPEVEELLGLPEGSVRGNAHQAELIARLMGVAFDEAAAPPQADVDSLVGDLNEDEWQWLREEPGLMEGVENGAESPEAQVEVLERSWDVGTCDSEDLGTCDWEPSAAAPGWVRGAEASGGNAALDAPPVGASAPSASPADPESWGLNTEFTAERYGAPTDEELEVLPPEEQEAALGPHDVLFDDDWWEAQLDRIDKYGEDAYRETWPDHAIIVLGDP